VDIVLACPRSFVCVLDSGGRGFCASEAIEAFNLALEAFVGLDNELNDDCCRRFGMLDFGRGSLDVGRGSADGLLG
jgi:hypothetical protein